MSVEFKGTEETKRLMPTIGTALEDMAFAQANDFIAAGQSAREAASIIANLMIRTAWLVAATGALTEGVEPDKDKFRSNVEAMLESIQFKDPSA